MDTINMINYSIMLLFFICYAYQFLYIPISLFVHKKSRRIKENNSYGILIAARNEENVIGNLIDSLKNQNYPSDLISIYVVADNCTDNTSSVAKEHGAIVYERYNTSEIGKGYALNFLLNKIKKDSTMPDAFIVFDSDNIVDSNYVSEINKTFNNGYQVITSYRNTKNYGDNWISSGYGLWFLREAMYLNQPRWKIGSNCGVSGTGFLFSSKVLEECGGWNFHLLTEDIEFTADCIVNNRKIGYCPKAIFYDEQPTSFKQSVTQRLRWSKGYLQVLGKYGKRLFKCTLKGKFSTFDMLMNITPATVLSWVSIIVNILAIVVSIIRSDSVSTILLSLGQSAMNLYLTMFFIGTITTITEWKKICCSNIKKVLYTFIFPIFMITYILISVIAPFTKSEWKPINHNKSLTLNDLKSYRKDVELN